MTTALAPRLDVTAPGVAANVAAAMIFGRPLYPHQLAAARKIDTPGTVTPYAYSTIVVLWPRQTGKTTLMLALALGRAMVLPDYWGVYAAQTGHITTKRFTQWRTLTSRGANARRFRNRASAGTERITPTIDLRTGARRELGGYLEAFPPLPGRLRSASLDLVIVDESQEHSGDLGEKLDADIVPVFDTRPRGQRIIAGTAGGIDAEYFRKHYRLAKDEAPGYLLLEIGTPPAGAPLDDPDTWTAHHPGVAAGMTTPAKLADARSTLGAQRFAREYLNQWDNAGTESVFPHGTWTACRDPDATITAGARAALALEVDPDRDHGVIAVAGPSTAGPNLVHVDIIGPFPLSRLVAAAVELTETGGIFAGTRIAVDPQAPTLTHIKALKRARVPTVDVTLPDVISASLGMYDRVRAATLTHIGDALLDVAASAAATRPLGSRWAFDRLAPSGHVIMAAAIAVHRAADLEHTPERTFIAG